MKRIVIVGAGSAGLATAKALRHADAEVFVVDRANHNVFQPLLYHVYVSNQDQKDVPLRYDNWRYDSGLVAGASPCYGVGAANDCPQSTTLGGQPAVNMTDAFGTPFTADQEFQAGSSRASAPLLLPMRWECGLP